VQHVLNKQEKNLICKCKDTLKKKARSWVQNGLEFKMLMHMGEFMVYTKSSVSNKILGSLTKRLTSRWFYGDVNIIFGYIIF